MNKVPSPFIKLFLVTVLFLLSTLSGAFAFSEFYLKKNWTKIVKTEITKNTGLKVEFGDVKFSFLSFLKLNPHLLIKDLKIGEAVAAKKFYVDAKLKSLFTGKLLVDSLVLDSVEFTLVENSKRVVSIKGLDTSKIEELLAPKDDEFKNEKDKRKESIKNINLDLLKIKNANILFEPYQGAPIRFRNLNLTIKNISISDTASKKNSKILFTTNFFDRGSSKLLFTGELETIPLDLSKIIIKQGHLQSTINLQDLPKEMLDSSAKLLAFNNSQKHLDLNAELQGDILNTLHGSGSLTLNDLRIGANAQNLLKLNSLLNLSTAIRLVKDPNLKLNISKGSIKIENIDKSQSSLGTLNFSLNSDTDLISFVTELSSQGSLNGLKFHEVSHAFDPKSKAPIEGVFSVPAYTLSTRGKNAIEQSQNLLVKGNFKFTDIVIPAIKELKNKKDKYMQFLPIDTSKLDKALEGNFLSADSNFLLQNSNLHLDNLTAKSKYADLKGSGDSSFAGILNFNFNLTVPERIKLGFQVEGDSKKPKIKINSFELLSNKALSIPDLGLKLSKEPIAEKVTASANKAVDSINKKMDSLPLTPETKTKAQKGINKLLDLGSKYGVYTKPNTETPINTPTTPNTSSDAPAVATP